MQVYDDLMKAYNSVKNRVKEKPDVALILGSGLGSFADNLEDKVFIPYDEIDGFPVSTVAGHDGKFVLGKIGDVNVIAMKGRVHYYEGYDMTQVVMPVRIMKLLGAGKLILTNAAGGMNPDFRPGDLMMITDHITSFVPSPLIGKNIDMLGTRFPDMSNVYDRDLQNILVRTAKDLDISLKHGIYVQTTGPNYETPAEVRLYRMLGGDAVGMSTACEAMAAMHMGMRIAGISCITNYASGISDTPLSHAEVSETANRISEQFTALIKEFIKVI